MTPKRRTSGILIVSILLYIKKSDLQWSQRGASLSSAYDWFRKCVHRSLCFNQSEERCLCDFPALSTAYHRSLVLERFSICQNWPARPVYSRTEFSCESEWSCQISQRINIIHCYGGFIS